ncbi:hypothetical protein [Caballeronia glathei]|uniref:hypothetical protein n=1 Tax=Caballeronia glathei TaxID=60547 RepID=UPI000566CD36|nr:hypothetical protein [Caballeronia glathei]
MATIARVSRGQFVRNVAQFEGHGRGRAGRRVQVRDGFPVAMQIDHEIGVGTRAAFLRDVRRVPASAPPRKKAGHGSAK